MPVKKAENKQEAGFTFRVKLGEYEVEITGTHEQVTKTIENLPSLFTNIHKALEIAKPKTVATITVKTEPPAKEADKITSAAEAAAQKYPKIAAPANCDEAVLKFLETDWGKWRPRTMEELKEAMESNGLKYPGRMLSATLDALAEKGKVQRWNTNTGFVYILAEEKASSGGGKAK
ncbi:MAG: hypothetical protein NWE94_09360 [Candidatus Bathyarchaeota archaeon]|nr:hypothetical protein [Candidatus Bathyarchaeota archaeon]